MKIGELNEIKIYLYTDKGKDSELGLWELQLSKVNNVYFGKCNYVQGEARALEILKDKIKYDLY
ncbi:hypothetical protein OCF65_22865 [Bacillus toyonensis]|uniref:hypothetical protein n=1 Tax=Bacillus toyonensis TaxID=155322 RepID=UPI0021CEB814|nr:hypothetical protein [Bacillus toyonensis]MCU4769413.1 hypothetical protein [Bacillus toyonensis]MCU5583266.1 hypothetical protein [Bacillus toyonensis]